MTWITKLVERLLWPSPEQIIHSIQERAIDPLMTPYLQKAVQIRNAEVMTYDSKIATPTWFRRQYAFQVRHVYQINKCELILPVGGVRVGSRWLQETFGHYRNVLIGVSSWRKHHLILSGSQTIDEPVTYLRNTGYYHFLLEALPSLLHVLKVAPNVLVLLEDVAKQESNGFLNDYVELLKGVECVKRVLHVKQPKIKCSHLYFTQAEEKSGFIHKDDIELLRSTIMPAIPRLNEGCKKIFITRKASRRSFDNQLDIEKLMDALGFVCVELERMTVVEQIQLFSQAEFVIANHGAGLANLIWCNHCKSVIELFSPKFLNDCYFRLACTMKIDYSYIIANKRDNTHWGVVDIEMLRAEILQSDRQLSVSARGL
jgi:Glycosyltransferase 61